MNINNPNQKGIILKPVELIQTYLREIALSYGDVPLIIPDGIYGPETKGAVLAFQQLFGLPVTGEVDLDTWDLIVFVYQGLEKLKAVPYAIYPYPYASICKGCVVGPCSEGDIVVIVQTMLNAIQKVFADFETVDVTGKFDGKTAGQVKTFQLRTGLKPTGQVDKETWNHLASFYNLYGVTR